MGFFILPPNPPPEMGAQVNWGGEFTGGGGAHGVCLGVGVSLGPPLEKFGGGKISFKTDSFLKKKKTVGGPFVFPG